MSMPSSFAAFWLMTQQGLFSADAAEPQRLATMRAFFTPSFGETVSIDAIELRERGSKDPMDLRGYVTVTPPAGRCFTITVNPDLPDRKVCNRTVVGFTPRELDKAGNLVWTISSGAGDPGFDYVWRTPHRFAQVIKASERPEHLSDLVPLLGYEYTESATSRRVTVHLLDGRHWTIAFPEHDTPAAEVPDPPKLYIQRSSKGGINEDSTIETATELDIPQHRSAARDAAKFESVQTYWAMPLRNSFAMPAENFLSIDGPGGVLGTCRYQYEHAPLEPNAGWIECHNTVEFDVVVLTLPELGKLKHKNQ